MPRYITVQTPHGYLIAAYLEGLGPAPSYTTIGREIYPDGASAEREIAWLLAGRPNIPNIRCPSLSTIS